MKDYLFTVFLALCAMALIYAEDEKCSTATQTASCQAIFSDVALCYNTTYKVIAEGCRVTCDDCDAYNCTNPQPDDILNCTQLEPQCNDPTFGPLLQDKCPAQCGTCMVTNGMTCEDVAEHLTCVTLEAFCNAVDYYDFMTQQCPSTCNRCPDNGTASSNGTTASSTCNDVLSDCATTYASLCTNALYDAIMRQKCARTCNLCGAAVVTTPASTCADTNNNCPTWIANGFCANSYYTTDQKRQYCGRSCGLC